MSSIRVLSKYINEPKITNKNWFGVRTRSSKEWYKPLYLCEITESTKQLIDVINIISDHWIP